MKKVLILLLCSILALFGCSSTKASEEVTLTVMSWAFIEDDIKTMSELMADAYMEENPNVTIEYVDFGGDYAGTLNSMAAAGELPDIYAVYNWSTDLQNGWLMDITQYVGEEFYNTPQWVQDMVTLNGSIMTVPTATQMYGVFVNNDMLDMYGIETMEYGTVTYEEFYNAAASVYDPDNGYSAIQTPDRSIAYMYPVMTGQGTFQAYNPETMEFEFDSPVYIEGMEEAAKWNEFSFSTFTDEQMELAGANESNDFNKGVAWGNGYILYDFGFSYFIPGYIDSGLNLSYLGVPGSGTSTAYVDQYGVSSDCDNPQAAVDFLEYMAYNVEKQFELKAVNPDVWMDIPVIQMTEEQITTYVSGMGMDIPGVDKALADIASFVPMYSVNAPGWEECAGNQAWVTTGVSLTQNGQDDSSDSVETIEDATIHDIWYNASIGMINYADYATVVDDAADAVTKAYIDSWVTPPTEPTE